MNIYNLIKNGFEIWDEGKKLNFIAGGINSDGTVWIRTSEDEDPDIKIFNVNGDNIEIRPINITPRIKRAVKKLGKDIIRDHCVTVQSHDIDYLIQCETVLHELNKNEYEIDNMSDDCVTAMGLGNNYTGQCSITDVESLDDRIDQCKLC